MLNIIQTSNSRIKLDPDAIRGIADLAENTIAVGSHSSVIYLEGGNSIGCSQEEATEIFVQWERYLDDPDDEDEEDDDEDQIVQSSIPHGLKPLNQVR